MAEFSIRRLVSSGILICVLSVTVFETALAQNEGEDWWFDIEFIAFKRDLLPGQPEDFSQSDYTFSDGIPFDLFTLQLFRRANPAFRLATSLPDCDPDKQLPTFDALTIVPFDTTRMLETAASYRSFVMPEDLSQASELISLEASNSKAEAERFVQKQQWLADDVPKIPNLLCVSELSYEPFTEVPLQFFKDSPFVDGQHSLLSNEANYLQDYSKRIFAQRGIAPLIYTAWRQPVVFGEENASYYRIFAGQRLDPSSTATGSEEETASISQAEENVGVLAQTNQQDDAVVKQLKALEEALDKRQAVIWDEDDETVDEDQLAKREITPAWELDGLFKVYLEYVNRVPYLHVASEFKHTRLELDASGEPLMEEYPSKQRRRIISKQIHYFDHPAFGIIIRLERYEKPTSGEQN